MPDKNDAKTSDVMKFVRPPLSNESRTLSASGPKTPEDGGMTAPLRVPIEAPFSRAAGLKLGYC
jgi:hypothetical protein